MNDTDEDEFLREFRARFTPSDDLDAAVRRFIESSDPNSREVSSVPGSRLHMVTITAGTAACQSFLVFETVEGGPSRLLPGPPPESSERDNPLCANNGNDGALARVQGADAFLETLAAAGRDRSYRFVPLRDGRWQRACSVDVRFGVRYRAATIFVPAAGPFSEAALATLAPRIVEAHAASADRDAFRFGPPVPDADRARVETMIDLAAGLSDDPIPAFGREQARDHETLRGAGSHVVVLDEGTYLMRLGQACWGCCACSDPIVILHSLRDGALAPVASVFLAQERGPLEVLRSRGPTPGN